MIATLLPQVAKTTFGKKMFSKVAMLIEQGATIEKVREHLKYQAGCSAPQRMVFDWLAEQDLQTIKTSIAV
jgi:hypothetical protein